MLYSFNFPDLSLFKFIRKMIVKFWGWHREDNFNAMDQPANNLESSCDTKFEQLQ